MGVKKALKDNWQLAIGDCVFILYDPFLVSNCPIEYNTWSNQKKIVIRCAHVPFHWARKHPHSSAHQESIHEVIGLWVKTIFYSPDKLKNKGPLRFFLNIFFSLKKKNKPLLSFDNAVLQVTEIAPQKHIMQYSSSPLKDNFFFISGWNLPFQMDITRAWIKSFKYLAGFTQKFPVSDILWH